MKVGWVSFEKSEGSGVTTAGESTQAIDSFEGTYDAHGLLPYPEGQDPKILRQLCKNSNVIPTCIQAYRQNVSGYGRGTDYKPGEKDTTAADEWDRANELLDTAVLDKPLESFLADIVDDLNECGNAYIEVSREGELPGLFRIAPENMRCTKFEKSIQLEYKRLYKDKVKTYRQRRWVRRYAQKIGSSIVWYREFGVPQNEFPEAANEIIHLRTGQNGPYGEPLWIGNTPGVIGARKSEELNVEYFDNGRMLAMLLTVINGELTQDSIEALKKAKGSSSQGGILVLEAIGYEKGIGVSEEKEKTEIKLDKLNDLLQSDALFLDYGKDKRGDLLSAFRLPPIYVGRSDDYNLATSNTARRITEEQVFIPYRKWLMDEIFNYRLFPAYDILRVRAYLNGPEITDPEERTRLLDYLADRGIMLVRHLIPIAEKVLNTTIDETKYTDDYLDTPIAQLASSQPSSFQFNSDTDNIQENVVTVAKRLLRQGTAEAKVHV